MSPLYTVCNTLCIASARVRATVWRAVEGLWRAVWKPSIGVAGAPSGARFAVVPGVYTPFWDHLADIEASLAAHLAVSPRMTAREVTLARVQADRLEIERPQLAAMLRSAVATIEALERALRDMDDARQQAVDRLARERRAWMVDRYRLREAA